MALFVEAPVLHRRAHDAPLLHRRAHGSENTGLSDSDAFQLAAYQRHMRRNAGTSTFAREQPYGREHSNTFSA